MISRRRDLEIVCSPANSLLLYNGRLGQFINGVTGRTPGGTEAHRRARTNPGVEDDLETMGDRSSANESALPSRAALPANSPSHPILPAYPLPGQPVVRPAAKLIALIGDAHLAAIESETIGKQPVNVDIDSTPVFVVREASDQPLMAFDRRLPNDLRPRFDLGKIASRSGGDVRRSRY